MVTEQSELPGIHIDRVRLEEVGGHPEWVDATLREHREAEQRVAELGRRRLSPPLRAVIWGLRVYVLFMVVVVIINIAQHA